MEMENKYGLEEMKRQLDTLHQSIERQKEISDMMIRKAMGRSADRIHNLGTASFIVSVFALLFIELLLMSYGVSRIFLAVTFLLFGANAVAVYMLKINRAQISGDGNLLDTAERMIRFRMTLRRSLCVRLPIALLWCCWCVYEIGSAQGMDDMSVFVQLGAGAVTGCLIGGCIGYFTMFRPFMKEAQNIIDQIDVLRKES